VGVHVGDPITMAYRSYKGSHLALLVELLAGPLVGGAIADKVGISHCQACTHVSDALWVHLAARVSLCKREQSMPVMFTPYTGGKRQLGQPCDCNRPQPAWRHGSFQVLDATSADAIQPATDYAHFHLSTLEQCSIRHRLSSCIQARCRGSDGPYKSCTAASRQRRRHPARGARQPARRC
jgi:hypothetical protein